MMQCCKHNVIHIDQGNHIIVIRISALLTVYMYILLIWTLFIQNEHLFDSHEPCEGYMIDLNDDKSCKNSQIFNGINQFKIYRFLVKDNLYIF